MQRSDHHQFFSKTDKSEEQYSIEFDKFAYKKGTRKDLYERRKNFASSKRPALEFQLVSDHQYRAAPVVFKGKTLALHCQKAGGFGDVAHTFLLAEKISQQFPELKIQINIQCPFSDTKEVMKVFPVDRFETTFISNDYFEREKQAKEIINTADCIFGVAVSISVPEFHHEKYASFREYGYAKHPDVKLHNMCMGFSGGEEGLNLPIITKREMTEIETPWLKSCINVETTEDVATYKSTHKLYHMYFPESRWPMKMAALYTLAMIEKSNTQSIDILLPLNYSLKNLIEWGALDIEVLKERGIGQLILVNDKGSEVHELGAGKVMRIFAGSINRKDMEVIEEHAEAFFGCTGNQSLSSAIVRGKIPFYADTGLGDISAPLCDLMDANTYPNLKLLFQLLMKLDGKEVEVYTELTPKKKSFYQEDPSIDFAVAHSLPRKSVPILKNPILEFSQSIAELVANPALAIEAKAFCAKIAANFAIEEQLYTQIYRGLVLKDHPELLVVEKQLREDYMKGQLTEEEVAEKFHAAVMQHYPTLTGNLDDANSKPQCYVNK